MGRSAAVSSVDAGAPVRREPIRKAPEDAFARAVEAAGGEKAMADRTGLNAEGVRVVLWDGVELDADLCPAVERAARLTVSCEDLRPDLVWHRDPTGEVIGYSCAIDHPRAVMAAALAEVRRPHALVQGQWDVESYRAGMLHGIKAEDAERLLSTTYGEVKDWCRDGVFDALQADVDHIRSDAAYHTAYGLLWDFDDETRDALMEQSGIASSHDWTSDDTEALWAKAQAIRFSHPEKSSIAAAIHAYGMACVADDAHEIAAIAKFHGIRAGSTWTAESYDELSEMVRAKVLKSMLAIEVDVIAHWPDILLGQSYGTRSVLDGEMAARMGQAAMNLLDEILPGITAIHDIQWVALDSQNADSLDRGTVRNLAVFLKSMTELTHLLVTLRDNMLFRVRQLEG